MPLAEQQADFAASLRSPSAPPPESLLKTNSVAPKRRFDVYRNNMVASLIEALRTSFPVTERLVGEEFFKATARAYVDHEPPRSPLLFLYGKSFGRFLESFPPAASVPYLGDIARLEWARVFAYHAEDRAAAEIDILSTLPPEQLGDTAFQLHPSLTLLTSRWPVFSIWASSSGQIENLEVDMGQAEEAIVIRPDFEVLVHRLPSGGYAFIRALQSGASLGEAAGQAAATCEDFNLAHHLEGLFKIGAVTGIHARRPESSPKT